MPHATSIDQANLRYPLLPKPSKKLQASRVPVRALVQTSAGHYTFPARRTWKVYVSPNAFPSVLSKVLHPLFVVRVRALLIATEPKLLNRPFKFPIRASIRRRTRWCSSAAKKPDKFRRNRSRIGMTPIGDLTSVQMLRARSTTVTYTRR